MQTGEGVDTGVRPGQGTRTALLELAVKALQSQSPGPDSRGIIGTGTKTNERIRVESEMDSRRA